MARVSAIVFAIGLGVVALNWVTTIIALAESRVTKKHVSPIWIPYVGPIGLTIGCAGKGFPVWTWFLPWALDVGTLAFLRVTPWLVGEMWRYSRFTRTMTIVGRRDNQSAQLSLHRGGFYLLKKKWQREMTETGIVELGESGTCSVDGPDFVLKTDSGNTRRLSSNGDGSYAVTECGDFPENYSLQDWVLHVRNGEISQCS